MAKRKAKQQQAPSLGDITLAKPDFEQALSFAEVVPNTDKPVDISSPALGTQVDMEREKVDAERKQLEAERQKMDAERALIAAERKKLESATASSSVPPEQHMLSHPTEIRLTTTPEQRTIKSRQSAAALMPQDRETCDILAERARTIATPVGQQQYEQRDQYLRFRLGTVELYGIPYQYLEELRYVGNLARVPCTPAFVAGVVNHRGELLTILDLKQFFRMPALALAGECRIVVVKHAGTRIGLLVDEVDGNEEYQSDELAPPLGSDGVTNMEYVLGIHAGRVTLLNVAALLNDPALRVMR
ncbi:MAG: chemotaxis protein CheW [Gallionella sp.]|nr:chemotaxis protein CheW [Gallionella sp.]